MEVDRDFGICTVLEALKQLVGEFAGKTIVDIGSGEGRLERQLAEGGAIVSGIDPLGPEQDWTNVGTGRFRLMCRGPEVLPIPDASTDLALFNFDGCCTLTAHFGLPSRSPTDQHTVSLLYHDETDVRRLAAETLSSIAPGLFTRHEIFTFRRRTVVPNYEQYITNMTATIRYDNFTEAELRSPAVKDRFDAVSARVGGIFDQPVRVDLLRP